MDPNCCLLQGEHDSLLLISFHQSGKLEQLAALACVGQLVVLVPVQFDLLHLLRCWSLWEAP